MALAPILITKPSVAYVKAQLETGDSSKTKRALQYICKLYRTGHRVVPADLVGLEQSIIGILYSRRQDEKLRRWALNALAQFGRADISLVPVLDILKEFSDDPQTAAAAIAAVYRMKSDAGGIIDRLDLFDPQIRALAGLQHVHHSKLGLNNLSINIENANSDILKLGLIVVGLNRAPSNIFHPNYSNKEIIKVLGGHHDPVVSQYTVWAVAENDNLSLVDLGIPISSVESLPANVRAWMFQLIAMTPKTAKENREYLTLGSADPDSEVRLGLATGLRDTFYDGIEPLVLDWYFHEEDSEVGQALMDHFVRHAARCTSYEQTAVEFYELAGAGSLTRQRMESCAVGARIYLRFRQISYDGSTDLFRSPTIMNTTINGGVQAGAVSIGGNASNSGDTNVHYQPQVIEQIRRELSNAIREIHNSTANFDLKEEALDHVKAAQANPEPEKISKAIGILHKVETVIQKADGIGKGLSGIGATIASLTHLAGF